MKVVLKLAVFTILVTAFYCYVGQMVPQAEVHPPKDMAVGANMTTEELVQAGKQIAEGKGTCMACHTIGSHDKGRFPDLGGIGARAATRKPGMSGLDYLAEALYDPNVYIVEGYLPGMPPIHKAPTNLSDPEMLAVIAYLQSLGGTPTVTPATKLKYATAQPASGASPATAVAGAGAVAAPQGPQDPVEILTRYGCTQCHSEDPKLKTLGPSFHGVGQRLKPAQIYESIFDPDAQIAKGFPPAVMLATLKATGFYGKASASEIQAIVAYLSASKGGKK